MIFIEAPHYNVVERRSSKKTYCVCVFFLLISSLFLGCSHKSSSEKVSGFECIMPGDVKLQTGDVVFRRGTGMASRVILKLDTASIYSHSGIVVDYDGKKMIAHAVADEPDFEGDVDRVKIDPIEVYFSDHYAECAEVCRIEDDSIARKAADIAIQTYERKVLFDHEYDDTDTTKMYCAELVVYAYKRAGIELVSPERHEVSVNNFHAICIFPSDLLNSKYLKSIYKF